MLLLFSVVILRPLVAETYDSSVDAIDAALIETQAPTPLRTLLFDLCILLGACGWLWSRAAGATERYRRTGLEIGVVILVLAAMVACAFARTQPPAINPPCAWLCLPLLTVTLAHLIRSSVVRRLVVAGVVATACVQALECVDQYFVAHADTLAHYESIKDDFWAQQGVDLSAPKVELYERRLKAHEAQGFLPHSNIAGSYLALCGMAALALAAPFWLRFR